jgi:hypothetical protein
MPDLTINLWTVIIGAGSGLVAVMGARGRNRLLMGAALGAATAVVLTIARGYF